MKLNQLFQNHIVFDAGNPIRVFGTGKGTVTVNFHGQTRTQTVTADKWLVELPAETYGGPYEMEIDLDGERVTLTDVYVGEVYLLAGQSNMEFKLINSATPSDFCVHDDRLRCFMAKRPEDGEADQTVVGWEVCDPETAGMWSALGYHFAREIAERKNVAVGLVTCYQGASVIQSWLPEEIAGEERFFVPPEDLYRDHFHERFRMWNPPAFLYHFSFEPLIPFAFHAVLWYQGESNASEAESRLYGEMLEAMICRWRADLMQPDLPFAVVQIANYRNRNHDAWHRIQRAQAEIADRLPCVVSVASWDVCEDDDIHPKTKHLLARRLADALN